MGQPRGRMLDVNLSVLETRFVGLEHIALLLFLLSYPRSFLKYFYASHSCHICAPFV